ncbi:MAG: glycosyltransferase family 4 protein [Lachnospiraceae bacterium]|nr:glycosyltransferase family 4 protein [Lachnospiraceae bacterium]
MKILMVNKFYYIKGGSETYYFMLKDYLESQGHEVIDFSMQDEKNFSSPYSKYFVSHVDYSNASKSEKLRAALNIIYSKEAKAKFEKLVLDTKPDVIHLHLFQHQISPSILSVIKKYKIPCVYTAHELKMICPNYKMLTQGHVCEACKNKNYFNCVRNKCVKNSYAKSAINMVEAYFHKWLKSYDAIDYIITPSAFYRKKFIEFGVDPNRVVHIPNFMSRDIPAVNENKYGKYYLYFGRLSDEKGIVTLIHAMEKTDLNLLIVGTGPLTQELEALVKNNSRIQLLGFKRGQELIDIVGNAYAVILPSEWYENGPYSAIEALQLGRPIIGADIAGIPELIRGNGSIFPSGNEKMLLQTIKKFDSMQEEEYHRCCDNSRMLYQEVYSAEAQAYKVVDQYMKAIKKHRKETALEK